MSRNREVDEEEKEKEDNREKAKEVEHQCGKFPKELVLWMRKSEDVTSDEYASFYSSLSHDWKENLSVKHFSVLGRLVARFVVRAKPRAFPSCVRATRKITRSCKCFAFRWMIATSSFQSGSISSVSCLRTIFLCGSLGRPCRKARIVLQRSASECVQGLQRKTA